MNGYARSWVFWIILILVVVILLVVFVGRGDSKYYEFSGINKIAQAHIDEIQNDINDANVNKPVYRISDDRGHNEDDGYNEDEQYYDDYPDEVYLDDQYDSVTEEVINLQPELPPEFMSEVSVGDPSGIKRTKPEKICRQTLERIYRKKFSRVHPEWLRNPETNRKLELDCYNDELKIACEYNGPQHYIWPNHFPMTKEQFLAQNRRDNFKLDACDANGVYLITVPYNVPDELIPDYINYYLPHNVKKRQDYGIA